MAVVTTGVHGAFVFGSVFFAGFFGHGKRVHVSAQGDGFACAAVAAFDNADYARTANTCSNFINADLLQDLGYFCCCAMSLIKDFRILMKITAPCGDFIVHFRKTIDGWHWSAP